MTVGSSRLVLSGRLLTLADASPPRRGSVLIDGGRIADVSFGGSEWDGTHIDVGDKVVMPGFIDPHAHVEVSSVAMTTMVDCRVPRCQSVADVLDVLREAVRERRSHGGWVRAQANLFFNLKLRDGRYPSLQELDAVGGDVPIAIHAGGHSTLLNSAAIARADLGRFVGNTKGAMGGAVIELDAEGRPTGVVSEIDSYLPIEQDEVDLPSVLARGAAELFTRYGVTVIGDITGTRAGAETLARLATNGAVPQRIVMLVSSPGTVPFSEATTGSELIGGSSPRAHVAGVKVFADGGYSSKNAATLMPYRPEYAVRPGSRGKINLDRRLLASLIRRANEAGLQLAVHANGERAQHVVLAAVEAAPRVDHLPTRVEHLGNLLTQPEATATWRATGVQPVPQPVFLFNFGDFFPEYLGPAASRGRFPFRRLLEEGWHLPGSSDVYVGAEERQTNPFFGIWCAVARQSFLGRSIEPDQAVDVRSAILMHTRYAAEALGLEQDYGSIERGKRADLIVLDRDPLQVAVDDLPNIRVDTVLIDGRQVYPRALTAT